MLRPMTIEDVKAGTLYVWKARNSNGLFNNKD